MKKFAIASLIILFLGIIYWQGQVQKDRQELIKAYDEKINTTLIHLFLDGNPHTELAAALEALSKADAKDVPNMEKQLAIAKELSSRWEDRVMQLVHLCDEPGRGLKAEYSLGRGAYIYRNATKQQYDVMIEAFTSDPFPVIYSISGRYAQKGAVNYTERDRAVLADLAKELRVMEKNYAAQLDYIQHASGAARPEDYMERLKTTFLQELKPSLANLRQTMEAYEQSLE